MEKIKKHTISFKWAFEGLIYSVRTQPNMIIHFSASAISILMGLLFNITDIEWAILSIIISIGIGIELINTSIESTVDLVTTKKHPLAKVAKDCAAAAMLCYAIGSIAAGYFLFISKLF